MLGSETEPGIIPQALEDLFRKMESITEKTGISF
jgi:hypothetical protein